MALLCEALHAPRSSVYAAGAEAVPTDGGKHGPKTALTDDALVEIRAVLAACRAVQREWIVERLGYRTPAQARRDALQEAA